MQLAAGREVGNVKKPNEIELPENVAEIQKVICTRNASVLLTKQGDVWMCGGSAKEAKNKKGQKEENKIEA